MYYDVVLGIFGWQLVFQTCYANMEDFWRCFIFWMFQFQLSKIDTVWAFKISYLDSSHTPRFFDDIVSLQVAFWPGDQPTTKPIPSPSSDINHLDLNATAASRLAIAYAQLEGPTPPEARQAGATQQLFGQRTIAAKGSTKKRQPQKQPQKRQPLRSGPECTKPVLQDLKPCFPGQQPY